MRGCNVLVGDLSPVAYYKLILNTFLDRRPPGIRQVLADAIGKDRSFISQISNAAYAVPIPARHVRPICTVCQFTPEEEQVFVRSYLAAHPDRAADIYGVARRDGGVNRLEVVVPALDSEEQRQRLEGLVQGMAREVADLVAAGTARDADK